MTVFDPAVFPRKLNLGCGSDRRAGYLNVDLNAFNKPDLVADVRDLSLLPSGHYEEIVAQDVLEHLPRTATGGALREWNRLLRRGGKLHLRVPSLEGLCEMFRSRPQFEQHLRLMQNLFGTQAYTGDFHLTSFTRVLMEGYLQRTGFRVAQLRVMDGWLFDLVAEKISNTAPSADARRVRLLTINDNDAFLREAYRLLLQREPDPEGFSYYLSSLDNGHLARQQVIDIIMGSPEYEQLPGKPTDI
ncbi:MAG: DUF4214 domain-containing protein [Pseudomonadota bacterium]|nr:DUF4214 domain-containing protein [Pseudomonadota bacterium]